jgi:hypothetical protein
LARDRKTEMQIHAYKGRAPAEHIRDGTRAGTAAQDGTRSPISTVS